MINGALGEDSQVHKTFGFYVDGVSPTTARLPQGWECRLVAVCNPNTNGATGWCLEVHDIAVAKSVAGREKDLRYIRDLWKEGLISLDTMEARLDATDIDADALQRLKVLAHAAAHRKPSQLPPGRPAARA